MSRREPNYVRNGAIGTVILVAAVVIALQGSAVSSLFGGDGYTAEFVEAGGIVEGNTVFVSGVAVGTVTSVELADDHVDVSFDLTQEVAGLGEDTTASIVSQTALGKMALSLQPAGSGKLSAGSRIPTSRTVPSFDVTDALNQLTSNVTEIDTAQLANSLDDVSEVLRGAAPEVRPALDGISRLSETLSSRDAELSRLLKSSAGVTTLLADRDKQIQVLFADGSSLLEELNTQRKAIDELFTSVKAVVDQLDGLVADNEKQIGPALQEINGVLEILKTNRANIDQALEAAAPLLRELGEVVAAFPGFNVYIPNLALTNLAPGLSGILQGARP